MELPRLLIREAAPSELPLEGWLEAAWRMPGERSEERRSITAA